MLSRCSKKNHSKFNFFSISQALVQIKAALLHPLDISHEASVIRNVICREEKVWQKERTGQRREMEHSQPHNKDDEMAISINGNEHHITVIH